MDEETVLLFKNSSLIPLSKLANSPNRSIRCLWWSFGCFMFTLLLTFIGTAIYQYSDHVTTFQSDFSEQHHEMDTIPGLTLCYGKREIDHIFLQKFDLPPSSHSHESEPWFEMEGKQSLKPYLLDQGDLNIQHYQLNVSQTTWSTQQARSKLYKKLYNFQLTYSVEPSVDIQVEIMEQVPHEPNFLCTTVIFQQTNMTHIWSRVSVKIVFGEKINVGEDGSLNHQESHSYPTMSAVVHDATIFPFGNYEKNIYEVLNPSEQKFIFFSKLVTKHLNLHRTPCREGHLSMYGNQYQYEQTSCRKWLNCERITQHCKLPEREDKCSCREDVLGYILHPCDAHCHLNESPYMEPQSSNKKNGLFEFEQEHCPQACQDVKFVSHNVIKFHDLPQNTTELTLVKSAGVKLLLEEEIYTLTKLFSEIGGLCSLFIGFTFIFLFELLEVFLVWSDGRRRKVERRNTVQNIDLGMIHACRPQPLLDMKDKTICEKYCQPASNLLGSNSTTKPLLLADRGLYCHQRQKKFLPTLNLANDCETKCVWELQRKPLVITRETLLDLLLTNEDILVKYSDLS